MDLATFVLTDEEGGLLAFEVAWESGDYLAVVTPDLPLADSSAYVLEVDVCDLSTDVTFSTGIYGGDLDGEPSTLEHNTYVLDLEEVTFSTPENFELLLGMFGVSPLLVGIAQADSETLTLHVAEGKKKVDGSYALLADGRSWTFDPADFTEQPYFHAQQSEVSLNYDGNELPIRDFVIEGTFAPDGSSMGGLVVGGVADTRELSAAFFESEEGVCELMADWGISCIPCEDGVELCLEVLAEDAVALIEPDLDIIP